MAIWKKNKRKFLKVPLTVKVNGTGSVRVDFIDHLIQFVVGHVVVELGQYLS